jgi:hypothetical protein
MSFAPGQFITAQRLNRLQTKYYWSQSSGTLSGTSSGSDVTGTAMSIVVETNGASASFWWTAAIYAVTSMAANANTQAFWDVNGSPVFALAQWQNASSPNSLDKGLVGNNWSTTIPTAGTYTFKLKYTQVSGASTLSPYTSLMVAITEVA